MNVHCWPWIGLTAAAACFGQVRPVVSQRTVSDRVTVVNVAPRFATAIRMPEPVSSVVVGDPSKFLAEHSEKEPTLVLVKPVTDATAESNLLVTTVKGQQLTFLVRSSTGADRPSVDFVLTYHAAPSFLVDETRSLEAAVPVPRGGPQERTLLDRLLERQQRAVMPVLYGMRTAAPDSAGDHVRAGVSEVVDQGHTVLVLFSVMNPQGHAIEILPPQIQLAGKVKKGFPVRRSRWGTSEQLAVTEYRLGRRRVGPGERADGVVVFRRPSFKQSNETVFLQVAESGAVDRPALAPIGFGVSAVKKETSHGE